MTTKVDLRGMRKSGKLASLIAVLRGFPEENLNMQYFSPQIVEGPDDIYPWQGNNYFEQTGRWSIEKNLRCCFASVLWLHFANTVGEREMPIPEFFMYFMEIEPWEARILLLSCEVYNTTRLSVVTKDKILEVLEKLYETGYIDLRDQKTYISVMRQYDYTFKA